MATIKDVAMEAGVSVGTVSKVLNNMYVKPKNKEKVDSAIEQLGYRVNIYARGMKAQQTHNVAIIVPDLINPFFAQLVNYVEQVLMAFGSHLFVCNSHNNAARELAYINMTRQNKVDGLIAITYSNLDEYLEAGLPLVSIDRHFPHDVCCVSSDSEMGGRLAAQKFIETGCKNVIYIRNGSKLEGGETLKRGRSFQKTCRAAHIHVHTKDFGEATTLYEEDIRKIDSFIEKIVKEGKCIYDGIFTSSDIHAILIKKKLLSMGVKIPQDVQLIGYDGLKELNVGDYVVSSIEQPIKEIALASVDCLIKLIEKKPVEKNTVLPVRFVNGGTTLPSPHEIIV